MLIAGILMVIGNIFWGISVWGVVVPIILFYFGTTFIWGNAFATAFTPFGKIAGYAGALYGALQIGGGAVISEILTYLPNYNQVPLGVLFFVASVSAWLIYEVIVLPNIREFES